MLSALDVVNIYISFFEKRKHKRIPNSPLVPENDPTTLFTSSGMQPLVPYLLGEHHPMGKRLVNIQNCFRAQDIDEVGDNRHTTFFRMLGNWSLGDYFKKEQLPWMWEFFTEELKLPKERLYISVFDGDEEFKVKRAGELQNLTRDAESVNVWKELGIPEEKIYFYGAKKNWWSRSGSPKVMPIGEIGGPDSEIFYDFGKELKIHENSKYRNKECHPNCECGRFLEIGNSVFIQYKKIDEKTFEELPQKNVDFGGGLERILAAIQNKADVFETDLFFPVINTIENQTDKNYKEYSKNIRVIVDHLVGSVFMTANGIKPSNKEQGYILRRLLRRGLDNFYSIGGKNIEPLIETIVFQYKETDSDLVDKFENIKLTILEEEKNYERTLKNAKAFIVKKYREQKLGDELMGVTKISADDAFILYSTHGLSPTQIKGLGFEFDDQEFAKKMEEHQNLSRAGAAKKFSGGLADHSEKTIKGHTATHLLHRALKDILGEKVYQTGSNITAERIRFDFHFGRKLTDEEIKKVEDTVNEKIKENLTVNFKIMDIDEAKKLGATGLFEEKYKEKVKVYFIGETPYYSIELCGGPHVDFTGELKRFRIIKQENLGKENKRIYASIDD